MTSVYITLNQYEFVLNPLLCRLLQNRKSAKKCRLKKKAELKNMLGDVSGMQAENKKLQDKVSCFGSVVKNLDINMR